MGNQNVHGSKGRNIVGTCNVIGKIEKKIKQMLVYTWGRGFNFVGKGYTQKPKIFVSHEQ